LSEARILDKLDRPLSTQMRALRALEVLEQVGGPEALRVVESLARGVPGAGQTERAKQACQRMKAASP
jgi:hypothetical protein